MFRRRLSIGLGALMALTACSGPNGPSAVEQPYELPPPATSISDGATGGNEHFYWLPPMVSNPNPSGTFDGALDPVVQICQLDGALADCDATQPADFPIVFTTTSGPGSETVTVDAGGEHYKANWHTNDFALSDDKFYRISVTIGQQVLGHADVDVVNNGKDLKNVDTNEYIGLNDGRTLPIKFRIEDGALDEDGPVTSNVAGAPNPAALGEDIALTADVDDTATGGSDIASAEYNVDGGSYAAMSAQDGDFDSATETVAATISGFATPGDRTVCVRGTDAAGNTGAESCATLSVQGFAWASVTVGRDQSCGVSTDGAAYCWGSHAFGESGTGLPRNIIHDTPMAITGGLTWAELSANQEYTCGLTTGGDAYCWGVGNQWQLGTTQPLDACSGGRECFADPLLVEGGNTWAALGDGFGGGHMCALRTDGSAYCWGTKLFGSQQLGNGGTPNQIPGPVSGGLTFVDLAYSGNPNCGLTAAGDAHCWGENKWGGLGNGTNDNRTFVPGPVLQGSLSFDQIDTGGFNTCAITTSGELYCWGFNEFGELGIGNFTGPADCDPNPDPSRFGPCSTTPIAVTGGLTFEEVSLGSNFVCAIATGGAAYCWGQNTIGQLGDGSTVDRASPTAVLGGHSFVDIDTGFGHACGVTTDGETYCWGRNSHAQLGDGSGADASAHPTPVLVVGPM